MTQTVPHNSPWTL